MNILVTGAEGFVGSYLASYFERLGYQIIRHDRTKTPLDSKSFGFDLFRFCPEVIIHCAAAAGPWYCTNKLIDDNLRITQALAIHAYENNISRFVFLSSTSIFGNFTRSVVDETHPIIDPTPYGMTKYLGEKLLEEVEIPSLSLRCPGIVGPNCNGRNWAVRTAREIHEGKQIQLYNANSEFNSVIHVSDIAKFIARQIELPAREGHESMILCADGPIPIWQATHTLAEAIGIPAKTVGINNRDVRPYIFSNAKAKSFGFSPMTVIETMQKYVEELRHEFA